MLNDNTSAIYHQFFAKRTKPLANRFNGFYRAMVVETDDPLRMRRVRFKCPDLHDWDLKPGECPWAVPCQDMGGKRAGHWTYPCIGDWIWITFERGHPYAPIWVGFADPTRRKFYPYPSIFGITPLPVDSKGNPSERPQDYNKEYLPKDFRPMSSGSQDRYGNLDLISSVGFFPVEHNNPPPDPDNDAIQAMAQSDGEGDAKFDGSKQSPAVNDPDLKYMVRITKYGHIWLMGDQGYQWSRSDSTDESGEKEAKGEFYGDVDKDEEWEVRRYRYLQRFLNEGEPSGKDQRRIGAWTRYGTFWEARDVGWNKTRSGEYDYEQRTIADKAEVDQRWFKIRTKGGFLFQMYDRGFDPEEDVFVKRLILDETGTKADHEDEWEDEDDARQIRLVGRYGFKFVIDERGSDTKDAEGKENPRGLGILLKGRRTPGAKGKEVKGDPRGFFWEMNEYDEVNQTTWGTPLGTVMQMNDRYQYLMLSSRYADYPRKWKKLKDNEFLGDSLSEHNIEDRSHHLKLDLENEYLSLKTRAGNGDPPWKEKEEDPWLNPIKLDNKEPQGLECRDGSRDDGQWVELVDANRRGLWFWGKGKIVMCRARMAPRAIQLRWWFDEEKREIVIRNNEYGRIQIFCKTDVEIIGQRNVNIYGQKGVTVKGDTNVVLDGGGGKLEVTSGRVNSTVPIYTPDFVKIIPNVNSLPTPQEAEEPKVEPSDRGKRYNK